MGNSGWCMSKNREVEYQTGEAYRSQNFEFTVDKKSTDKSKDTKMEKIINKMSLKLTNEDLPSSTADNESTVQAVSY